MHIDINHNPHNLTYLINLASKGEDVYFFDNTKPLAKMSFLTSDNNQSKDSLTESRKQLMGKYDFQIPDDFNETPQELIDSINKPFAL